MMMLMMMIMTIMRVMLTAMMMTVTIDLPSELLPDVIQDFGIIPAIAILVSLQQVHRAACVVQTIQQDLDNHKGNTKISG